jgi:hypothetical protein
MISIILGRRGTRGGLRSRRVGGLRGGHAQGAERCRQGRVGRARFDPNQSRRRAVRAVLAALAMPRSDRERRFQQPQAERPRRGPTPWHPRVVESRLEDRPGTGCDRGARTGSYRRGWTPNRPRRRAIPRGGARHRRRPAPAASGRPAIIRPFPSARPSGQTGGLRSGSRAARRRSGRARACQGAGGAR